MVNDCLGVALFLYSQFQTRAKGEASVANTTAPKFHNLASAQNLDTGLSRSERSGSDATARLTPGAALVVVLFLSLGLWAVLWLALSYLAALWFG